jgi:hypothetical protein
MAKLNRESKLRERRAEKQARKAARKLTAADSANSVSAGGALGVTSAGVEANVPGSAEANEAAAVGDVAGGLI